MGAKGAKNCGKMEERKKERLTAINVPGRNSMVRMVMAFMDELCWAA
jgi:hypothetical protein